VFARNGSQLPNSSDDKHVALVPQQHLRQIVLWQYFWWFCTVAIIKSPDKVYWEFSPQLFSRRPVWRWLFPSALAPCILVEVHWCFRGACCFHHQGDLIVQTASTTQMSVNFYHITRRNNSEERHFHQTICNAYSFLPCSAKSVMFYRHWGTQCHTSVCVCVRACVRACVCVCVRSPYGFWSNWSIIIKLGVKAMPVTKYPHSCYFTSTATWLQCEPLLLSRYCRQSKYRHGISFQSVGSFKNV
jgi:hypothetical protein